MGRINSPDTPITKWQSALKIADYINSRKQSPIYSNRARLLICTAADVERQTHAHLLKSLIRTSESAGIARPPPPLPIIEWPAEPGPSAVRQPSSPRQS